MGAEISFVFFVYAVEHVDEGFGEGFDPPNFFFRRLQHIYPRLLLSKLPLLLLLPTDISLKLLQFLIEFFDIGLICFETATAGELWVCGECLLVEERLVLDVWMGVLLLLLALGGNGIEVVLLLRSGGYSLLLLLLLLIEILFTRPCVTLELLRTRFPRHLTCAHLWH